MVKKYLMNNLFFIFFKIEENKYCVEIVVRKFCKKREKIYRGEVKYYLLSNTRYSTIKGFRK